MKKEKGIIKSNQCIALHTYKMVINSSLSQEMKPGQFVNILIDGYTLRRPISISSIGHDEYTIIYKVVGEGTNVLSRAEPGDVLDIIAPLGNPFPIHDDLNAILIVGGGGGIPPLYEVAKRYKKLYKHVEVVLGFQDYQSVFYEKEFQSLGCNVTIATMDGSYGIEGSVMDAIHKKGILQSFLYACGPMAMLKSLHDEYTKGYISFEARMACGFGACMGCVCKDSKDSDVYYRICKEGPVFEIGKVEL